MNVLDVYSLTLQVKEENCSLWMHILSEQVLGVSFILEQTCIDHAGSSVVI